MYKKNKEANEINGQMNKHIKTMKKTVKDKWASVQKKQRGKWNKLTNKLSGQNKERDKQSKEQIIKEIETKYTKFPCQR